MGQNLFLRFPIEVTLCLLAAGFILLAVARVLIALGKPVQVRAPASRGEVPYKIEAPSLLRAGRLEVVPQAGREPANR